MVTEDYVSFETAKLLKEKGFDEVPVCTYYLSYGGFYMTPMAVTNKDLYAHGHIAAPTLQMVMKWLREKHIFITLDIISFNLNDLPVWSFDVWHNNNHEYRYSDYFDSYEQTCETAIKYCLKHLL